MRGNAGIVQLRTRRFPPIEEPVAGPGRRRKPAGDLLGRETAALEAGAHVGADLVAGGADRRPNRRKQGVWRRPGSLDETANRSGGNSCGEAAPSGVRGGDGAGFGIDQ